MIFHSVGKNALYALTVEYAKAGPAVRFHAASPGRCKAAFNGYQGTKDPLDGERVVVKLVGKQKYENGFGNSRVTQNAGQIPW